MVWSGVGLSGSDVLPSRGMYTATVGAGISLVRAGISEFGDRIGRKERILTDRSVIRRRSRQVADAGPHETAENGSRSVSREAA